MNDNNVADQLHLVYRMQRFQQNQKWRWALFMWMYKGLIANSYKMMEQYCFLKGLEPTYNHHDYMEKLGYPHLDLENELPRRRCHRRDRLVDDQS